MGYGLNQTTAQEFAQEVLNISSLRAHHKSSYYIPIKTLPKSSHLSKACNLFMFLGRRHYALL
jgi:hypothetical protein